MTTTCVYTAILGGYGELQPHPDVPGVRWVAYTDDPALVRDDWEVRTVEVPASMTPRKAAKFFKFLPHTFLPDHERTIWVDGTVRVDSPTFADEALACLGGAGLALWRHPERDCIYAEALVPMSMPKYAREPVLEQVAHYFDDGYPVNAGLWACGVLARSNEERVNTLMEDWFAEVDRWSVQDQLSLPYCMWALGFTPAEFPASLYDNPWLTVTGHDPYR